MCSTYTSGACLFTVVQHLHLHVRRDTASWPSYIAFYHPSQAGRIRSGVSLPFAIGEDEGETNADESWIGLSIELSIEFEWCPVTDY